MERIGILGGVRIPFARKNPQYVASSNLDMLTAVLAGIVQRFGLQGERLGEVAAGAAVQHPPGFNLPPGAAPFRGLPPPPPADHVPQRLPPPFEDSILGCKKN